MAQLFAGTHLKGRFETCGWLRRKRASGPRELVHVVIARRGDAGPAGNLVWRRAARLVEQGVISLVGGQQIDPEHVLLDLTYQGVRHRLVRSYAEGWGADLVQYTGPLSYWRMCLWRLQAAGTVRLRHSMPALIDRSGPYEKLIAYPCPDEQTFVRWCRTRYKLPWERWEQEQRWWMMGMLSEWYPPGARPSVDPFSRPDLFPAGVGADPRYRPRDRRLWGHR